MQHQQIFYKIVKVKDGKFFTLFHAINGSKELKVGQWIEDQRREHVRDGSGERYYTSGIHVVKGLEEIRKYCKRFRKGDRVIIKCYAEGLRRKEHSRSNVFLADRIFIISNETIPVKK